MIEYVYIYIHVIEYLDLLLRCLEKSSQKSSDPNGGSLRVMNPMVQSVKHQRINKSKLKMRGNLIPFFQRVVTGVIPKKKHPNCQRGTLLNNFQGEPKNAYEVDTTFFGVRTRNSNAEI